MARKGRSTAGTASARDRAEVASGTATSHDVAEANRSAVRKMIANRRYGSRRR